MPRRNDLESICIVGSGPIVIGQAAEFDYAGCQALKVLREEGFRTIVVNSNPATIMTDPGFADRTYLEPLDAESVAEVLRLERPDALLPTMGGQTALNLARELATEGVLDELGIELVGARLGRVRARGGARPDRQRRDRLLDREPRSDGRPHGRLGHGRAADDAARRGVSGAARRGRGGHPRGGRRHRRLEHPVRPQPRDRRGARDRDETAGVALLGARLAGDPLPD